MKNKLTTASSLTLMLLASTAFAKTEVTTDYRYYDSDKSFHKGTAKVKSTFGDHTVFAHYGQVRDMDPDNHILNSAGVGYVYFSDTLVAGGGIGSASDDLFASPDVTDVFGFVGYTLYSKDLGKKNYPMPDGSTYTHTRKTRFILGVMGTTKPIYRTYVLPVIGFMYEGEKLRFSIGLPETRISFEPNEYHEFSLSYEDNDNELKYTFKPIKTTKLSVMYSTDSESYAIQSDVEGKDRMNRKLHFYYREWFKVRIDQQLSKGIKGYVEYGHQLDGRYKYAKSFSKHRSTKLEDADMYRIGLSFEF